MILQKDTKHFVCRGRACPYLLDIPIHEIGIWVTGETPALRLIREWNLLLILILILYSGICFAGEISSNAKGGGKWTDTATWRGGKLPSEGDTAYISGNDVVLYNGSDTAIACRDIMVDPEAIFAFEDSPETKILVIDGTIVLYGTMSIDGRRHSEGRSWIFVSSPPNVYKGIVLYRGAKLIIEGCRGETKNIYFTGFDLSDTLNQRNRKGMRPWIYANDGSFVSVKNASFDYFNINAYSIDGSGSEFGEGAFFEGNFMNSCGITFIYCTNNKVRNNVIRNYPEGYGIYNYVSNYNTFEGNDVRNCGSGIFINHGAQSKVTGNILKDNINHGVHCYAAGGIYKDNVFDSNYYGIIITNGPGYVLENNVFVNNKYGIYVSSSEIASCADSVFGKDGKNVYADIYALYYGKINLLNCLLLSDTPVMPIDKTFTEVRILYYLDLSAEEDDGRPIPGVGYEIAGEGLILNSSGKTERSGHSPLPSAHKSIAVQDVQLDSSSPSFLVSFSKKFKYNIALDGTKSGYEKKGIIIFSNETGGYREVPDRPEKKVKVIFEKAKLK